LIILAFAPASKKNVGNFAGKKRVFTGKMALFADPRLHAAMTNNSFEENKQ
jgi:hypothetical protein